MTRQISVSFAILALSTISQVSAQPAPPADVVAQRVRVKHLHHAVVAADRVGLIANDMPIEGDVVGKDEVVVELSAAVPRAALAVGEARAQSRFQVDAARKEFEVSEVELEMAREANAEVRDSVPEIEVLRLRLTRDRNELRIDFAESERRIAELDRDRMAAELDTFVVRAPLAGTVVKVHKMRGEPVQQGEPIFEITDASQVRVEGFVTVAEALRLQRGDEVVVRPVIEGLDRPAAEIESKGRIVFVDLSVQKVTELVQVWAKVENHQGLLLDGLEATLEITPGTAPAGTTVSLDREHE